MEERDNHNVEQCIGSIYFIINLIAIKEITVVTDIESRILI